MRFLIVCLFVVLTGCRSRGGPRPASTDIGGATNLPSAAAGNFGIDISAMDPRVRPGDDFWNYANGRWAANVTIPPESGSTGPVAVLTDLANRQVRDILEEFASQRNKLEGDDRRVGEFYASVIDQNAINNEGAAALKADVRSIRSASTHTTLAGEMGRLVVEWLPPPALSKLPRHYPSLFWVAIDQDPRNPDRYVARLGQTSGRLGMPREYYRKSDSASLEVQRLYRQHLATMLELLDVSPKESGPRAASVYAFEKDVAEAWAQAAAARSEDASDVFLNLQQLKLIAPGFDWDVFLTATQLRDRGEFAIADSSSLRRASGLYTRTAVPVLQDWVSLQLAKDRAAVLPNPFQDSEFGFYSQVLSGTSATPPHWLHTVELTAAAMPDAVSKPYVDRYFPIATKRVVDSLVKNIVSAMDRRLSTLSWMQPETRQKARQKLALVKPLLGYPDKWRTYAGLNIKPSDPYGNFKRAGAFEYSRQLARIDQPLDREEWALMPITPNGYASAANNQIVFTAAYLQPPIFDPKSDAAVNYGGFGSTIGHELSHFFDSQGNRYDVEGRDKPWWTEQDLAAFDRRKQKLIAQYDAYEPLPGLHIRGAQTANENVADNGGLAVAFDAYKLSLGGKPAPEIAGFTGDQRFFLAWAQDFKTVFREAALRNVMLTSDHAPSKWRAFEVRNQDAWYDAFGIKPQDKLYLPKEQRVDIWR